MTFDSVSSVFLTFFMTIVVFEELMHNMTLKDIIFLALVVVGNK